MTLGLAAMLHRVFLADGDGWERRQALPAFWAALAVGTLARLGLLVAVNYFSLQAGEAAPLSRWINR
jgi:hypothetical protein